MSEEQFNSYMEALQRVGEKIEADPQYGRRLMIKAGILDEHGELTEPYRQPSRYLQFHAEMLERERARMNGA